MAEYKVKLRDDIFTFDIPTQKISNDHVSFLKKMSDKKSEFISSETMKVEDILKANQEICYQIIQKEYDQITNEHFNFLVSTSGMKGKDLAVYLDVDPSHISQWRRGQKEISKAYWKLSCIILLDIIKNGKLTLEPLLFKNRAA